MKTVLTVAVAALSIPPLAAQQFRPERFAPIPPRTGWVPDIATGDIDGDGFEDLVLALDRSGIVHLRADGNGGFVDVSTPALRPSYSAAYGVSLGDVDGDGDLDLAAVHDEGGITQILLNQSGTFVDATATWSPAPSGHPIAVAWLDIDGDGALDLYVSGWPGDRLLRQSNGRLVDVTQASIPPGVQSLEGTRVQPLDIDADGDVDVVLLGSGTENVLLNDGTGHFTRLPPAALPTAHAVVLGVGDLDGDGRADLVAQPNNQMPQLWLQLPNGTFVNRTAMRFPSLPSLKIALTVDVDLDGDLDLCTPDRLLVNTGSGHFIDASSTRWTRLSAASTSSPSYATGDFDGDGDPDFAFPDKTSSQIVSVNHHRQVSAPNDPQIGQSYPIDFELAPGYATTTAMAVPWFAAGPASLSTPIGHLGIDPSTVVALPTVTVPGPSGRGRLQLRIPDQQVLVGATFYFQAVMVQPSGIALSNTVRDQIH